MHFAAMKVKGDLNQDELQHHGKRLHVLLKLWRCLRADRWSTISSLVARFPSFQQYVDCQMMTEVNIEKLKNDISDTFNDNTTMEIQELEADMNIKECKKNARRAALLNRQRQ